MAQGYARRKAGGYFMVALSKTDVLRADLASLFKEMTALHKVFPNMLIRSMSATTGENVHDSLYRFAWHVFLQVYGDPDHARPETPAERKLAHPTGLFGDQTAVKQKEETPADDYSYYEGGEDEPYYGDEEEDEYYEGDEDY